VPPSVTVLISTDDKSNIENMVNCDDEGEIQIKFEDMETDILHQWRLIECSKDFV